MGDIIRRRQQSKVPFSMTTPSEVTDQAQRKIFQELQDNIEELAQRNDKLSKQLDAIGDVTESEIVEIDSATDVKVPVSGADIQSVGSENIAGSGDAFSLENHVHQFVYIAATFAELSNTNIPEIALARVIGEDADDGNIYKRNAANDGWEEIGIAIYVAVDKGSLPAVTAPAFGYETTTDHGYMRVGSIWLCITHLE